MKQNKKFGYSNKISTKIWSEKPASDNPYLAEEAYIFGYDVCELSQKKSFTDVVFLLFKGELPTPSQSELLNQLMVLLISQGPREAATRAAMVAAVGKANHEHILPIGLQVLGGQHNGSIEVEQSVKFIQKYTGTPVETIIQDLPTLGVDEHPFPGFGSTYGDICPLTQKFAQSLPQTELRHHFSWCQDLVTALAPHGYGWLKTGLVAAVLTEMGFGAREAGGIFQIMSAPGILAHGMEQNHKPITAMPLLEDDNYVLKR